MEFCAGGDLSRFIHTRRILPEKVARVFMQQLGERPSSWALARKPWLAYLSDSFCPARVLGPPVPGCCEKGGRRGGDLRQQAETLGELIELTGSCAGTCELRQEENGGQETDSSDLALSGWVLLFSQRPAVPA